MAERRGVKRDCTFLSLETPLGTTHLLKRDCGDDQPYEILHHIKGLLVNEPEIIVAAVGGIPDELKIKDGISFSYPCPTVKIPKNLPEDPIQRYMALDRAFEESMIENDVENAADRAYAKALGICEQSEKEKEKEKEAHHMNNIPTPSLLQVICKQFEEGEALHNINQLPPTMIEVNVPAPSPPPPPPPPVHPIPTSKQAAREEKKSVKSNMYSLHTEETRHGTRQFLKRDCGDGTTEVIVLKGVLVNEPEAVLAVGGIPDELKMKGGTSLSFWFPCPILKFPKKMPQDQTERDKVLYKIHKEAMEKCDCKNAFLDAYHKALRIRFLDISEQTEEEKEMARSGKKVMAHNIHQELCTMIEINLAGPILHKDQVVHAMRWIFLK